MSLNNNLNKILIIDFGSQFTQLIARRIRELGVFSEIISHNKINRLNVFKNVKGVGGATILGSGEVAMILDIPILLQTINNISSSEMKE